MRLSLFRRSSKAERSLFQAFIFWFCIICAFAILWAILGYDVEKNLPEAQPDTISETLFSEDRARATLHVLTESVPHRLFDTSTWEQSLDYLLGRIVAIQQAKSPYVEMEITNITVPLHAADQASGFTMLLHNCRNIVVRLSNPAYNDSKEAAFMMSAHVDSHYFGPGANDDASAIVSMLETLRAMSRAGRAADVPRYSVIFNFLGEEEFTMGGSSNFVFHHPWNSTVRAFLNLESTGQGGRAAVIRDGPHGAWLMRHVAEVPARPISNGLLFDIFGSGLVPSYTDWTNYAALGHAGVDTATVNHAEIYHTIRDDYAHVTRGSLQHQGDLAFHLARKVADLPDLPHAATRMERDASMYYSLGNTLTVWSLSGATAFGVVMVVLAVVYLALRIFLLAPKFRWGAPSRKAATLSAGRHMALVGLSALFAMLSFLGALVAGVVLALVTKAINPSSFLTHWWTAVPLFGFPALAVVCALHAALAVLLRRIAERQYTAELGEAAVMQGGLLWLCILTLVSVTLGLRCQYLFSLKLAFSLIGFALTDVLAWPTQVILARVITRMSAAIQERPSGKGQPGASLTVNPALSTPEAPRTPSPEAYGEAVERSEEAASASPAPLVAGALDAHSEHGAAPTPEVATPKALTDELAVREVPFPDTHAADETPRKRPLSHTTLVLAMLRMSRLHLPCALRWVIQWPLQLYPSLLLISAFYLILNVAVPFLMRMGIGQLLIGALVALLATLLLTFVIAAGVRYGHLGLMSLVFAGLFLVTAFIVVPLNPYGEPGQGRTQQMQLHHIYFPQNGSTFLAATTPLAQRLPAAITDHFKKEGYPSVADWVPQIGFLPALGARFTAPVNVPAVGPRVAFTAQVLSRTSTATQLRVTVDNSACARGSQWVLKFNATEVTNAQVLNTTWSSPGSPKLPRVPALGASILMNIGRGATTIVFTAKGDAPLRFELWAMYPHFSPELQRLTTRLPDFCALYGKWNIFAPTTVIEEFIV